MMHNGSGYGYVAAGRRSGAKGADLYLWPAEQAPGREPLRSTLVFIKNRKFSLRKEVAMNHSHC